LFTITFFLSSSVLVMFILCLFVYYSYFVLHSLNTSFWNQLAFFSHSSCATPHAIAPHVISCATLFTLLLSHCYSLHVATLLALPFLACYYSSRIATLLTLLFLALFLELFLTLHLLHAIPFAPSYHAIAFTSFLSCCSSCDVLLVL
jgi:hypothetical protein